MALQHSWCVQVRYWRGSHVTLYVIEALSATMTDRGNPYGAQIPHQFVDCPMPLTTRVLWEMEIAVFAHQLLHRGTQNDPGKLHARVFGYLQGAAGS